MTFIVPAHNEERLLGRTLAALHAAARGVGEPYEIIVVDDASTDATAEIATSHGARVVNVKYRHNEPVPFYASALLRTWLVLQRLGNMANGCFIFCPREAFVAAGGFDESLYMAEDVAMSRRLKRLGRFVVLREAVITSPRKVRSLGGNHAAQREVRGRSRWGSRI